MPVSYPATLPSAGLSGAGGASELSVISDEKPLGEQLLRQREGIANQKIAIDFPPINQATYELFLEFFEDDLYGGILPFVFNDPITKDNHTYKFVNATPSFTETRVTPDWIKISFQLIRLKFVAGATA